MDARTAAIYRRLPIHALQELAIYGGLSIYALQELEAKEALNGIFVIRSDHRKVFLGFGSVIFPTESSRAAKNLHQQESYGFCIVDSRHESFPSQTSISQFQQLQAFAADIIGELSSKASNLVQISNSQPFPEMHIRTSFCDVKQTFECDIIG